MSPDPRSVGNKYLREDPQAVGEVMARWGGERNNHVFSDNGKEEPETEYMQGKLEPSTRRWVPT